MKFDVCIDMVFSGRDPCEALEELKTAGISRYEFWSWQGKDLNALARKQQELGMECVLFCLPFVSPCDPGQRDVFLAGVKESIPVAKKLGAGMFITQTGSVLPHMGRRQQWDCMAGNLQACIPLLEEAGLTLLVEPVNQLEQPGGFLRQSADAFEMIRQVNSPFVRMLYDIYHYQIIEGNLISTIMEGLPLISHFHCAGNPWRGNITGGEVSYPAVLNAIYQAGYRGGIGLEGTLGQDVQAELKKALAVADNACTGR